MGKKKWKEMSHLDRDKYMSKVGNQLGVNESDYYDYTSRPDRGLTLNKEKYQAAVQNTMGNDYDTRRAMEAKGLSGNKKAQKFAEKGIASAKDVFKSHKLMEKFHQDNGNGGDFSSASDYAGVAYKAAQQERKDYGRDFATVDDLNSLRDDLEQQEEASDYTPKPIEKSDALARAEDRLSGAEGYNAGSIYESNNRPAATDNTTADVTQSFLFDYKDKVKEKFGPMTNTEREVSNAAKRVQDSFGR